MIYAALLARVRKDEVFILGRIAFIGREVLCSMVIFDTGR